MYLSTPMDRLYTPVIACWWLGLVVCAHWWAGMGGIADPPKRHLRLIADHGKLVEQR